MDVRAILVPYDSGAHNARMGRGPHAIMHAGFVDRLVSDGHRVHITELRAPGAVLSAEVATSFALQRDVADAVRAARVSNEFPVVLSGNCNTAVGTVGALGTPAVCWFDAHADFNTPETTTSGFLDGMAVSMLVGDCWQGMVQGSGCSLLPIEHLVLLGTRDVDPAEGNRMKARSVASFDAARISANDHLPALARAREAAETAYVHVDLDVLDPTSGRANSYAVPNGLSLDTLHRVIGTIGEHFDIGALALTAYDPEYDPERRVARAAVEIASRLLLSLRET
jgi:arginase